MRFRQLFDSDSGMGASSKADLRLDRATDDPSDERLAPQLSRATLRRGFGPLVFVVDRIAAVASRFGMHQVHPHAQLLREATPPAAQYHRSSHGPMLAARATSALSTGMRSPFSLPTVENSQWLA